PSDRYITYAAAKAGLNHLVRAMALDFSGQGVRVNGISPGGMTPLDHTPDLEQNKTIGIHYALGRYPSVEEIGHTVVFLASEQSGGITGQIITVDGGSSVPLQHTLFNRAVQSVKDDPERFGITP
ncbi:MAG: SDR family oxidoreductase, partial [Candidatus Latescibacteria bacterium]|nr:SDR family oxidoreductase [Candidatus Latescibacterota bacterium]